MVAVGHSLILAPLKLFVSFPFAFNIYKSGAKKSDVKKL